ncbi:MAG: type II toxin-antitoxin system VapC family toxin [Clostridia bacterium]|nr:type II toxin-antitoxin system VapC family toxin [Clostridia bacterium]
MYLLDTNALICVLFTPDRMSSAAKQQAESSQPLYVSIASLWEIAIKQSIGKLAVDASITDIAQACATLEIKLLPIQPDHLEGIKTLPRIHNDPFDRLIIAQAIAENLTIITMDQIIPQYSVNTLW